jgi:hypothetical protein
MFAGRNACASMEMLPEEPAPRKSHRYGMVRTFE